jgi:hypothetical protein
MFLKSFENEKQAESKRYVFIKKQHVPHCLPLDIKDLLVLLLVPAKRYW